VLQLVAAHPAQLDDPLEGAVVLPPASEAPPVLNPQADINRLISSHLQLGQGTVSSLRKTRASNSSSQSLHLYS